MAVCPQHPDRAPVDVDHGPGGVGEVEDLEDRLPLLWRELGDLLSQLLPRAALGCGG
jgi:hypothetical protein